MFADLLRIKKFREDKAERDVKVAEAKLAERLSSVKRAEEALKSYHDFRLKEEIRLFNEIRGEKIHVAALEKMKRMVALLRDEEQNLEQDLEKEKQTVPPAKENVRKAEEIHSEAVMATEKFKEFISIQMEIESLEEGRREEAESEEVIETMFGSARS